MAFCEIFIPCFFWSDLAWTQTVSGHSHLDNCSPWTSPQDNCTHDFCSLDTYPWIITTWATTPLTIDPYGIPPRTSRQLPLNSFPIEKLAPMKFFLDFCHQDILPWIIPPWATSAGQLPLRNFSKNKRKRTSALDNYFWIIYRWHSKKNTVYTLQFRNFE